MESFVPDNVDYDYDEADDGSKENEFYIFKMREIDRDWTANYPDTEGYGIEISAGDAKKAIKDLEYQIEILKQYIKEVHHE